MKSKTKISTLFGKELKIINMGLESFALDLKASNVDVVQMDWRPPAAGNKKLAAMLNLLKD